MTELQAVVDDVELGDLGAWQLSWLDRSAGIARLSDGTHHTTALVEGGRGDWAVTIRGRRMRVALRTWRERMLAEADIAAHAAAAPLEVRASLPGLVLTVDAVVGGEVAAGDRLLTIQAMKMENEVRAPRAGRVAGVEVTPGQTIDAGATLVRLE